MAFKSPFINLKSKLIHKNFFLANTSPPLLAHDVICEQGLLLFPVLHDKVPEVVARGLVKERVAAAKSVLALAGASAAEENLKTSKCTDEKLRTRICFLNMVVFDKVVFRRALLGVFCLPDC